MAQAYKCDRCSKFFEKKDFNTGEKLSIDDHHILMDQIQIFIKDSSVKVLADICPDCCRALAQFMANKEVKPS